MKTVASAIIGPQDIKTALVYYAAHADPEFGKFVEGLSGLHHVKVSGAHGGGILLEILEPPASKRGER